MSGMTLARAEFYEVDEVWKKLRDIEVISKIVDVGFDYDDFEEKICELELDTFDFSECDNFREILYELTNQMAETRYQCAMFNLDTLLRNCVDMNLDYVDFKPSIKNGLELLNKMPDELIDPSDCLIQV